MGCIAGDDTVFIAVRSEAFAKEISQRIQSLIMSN
jgi:arginine repressor